MPHFNEHALEAQIDKNLITAILKECVDNGVFTLTKNNLENFYKLNDQI